MDWKSFNDKKAELNNAFPQRPVKPVMERHMNSKAAYVYATELEKWEKDVAVHKEAYIEWQRRSNVFSNWAQSELLVDVGLENHPKKNVIFSFAWDKGHSNGWEEVHNWLEQIAEFISALES